MGQRKKLTVVLKYGRKKETYSRIGLTDVVELRSEGVTPLRTSGASITVTSSNTYEGLPPSTPTRGAVPAVLIEQGHDIRALGPCQRADGLRARG
jgi:hypothetical protein